MRRVVGRMVGLHPGCQRAAALRGRGCRPAAAPVHSLPAWCCGSHALLSDATCAIRYTVFQPAQNGGGPCAAASGAVEPANCTLPAHSNCAPGGPEEGAEPAVLALAPAGMPEPAVGTSLWEATAAGLWGPPSTPRAEAGVLWSQLSDQVGAAQSIQAQAWCAGAV